MSDKYKFDPTVQSWAQAMRKIKQLETQLAEAQGLLRHAEDKKLTVADLAMNTILRRTERAERAEKLLANAQARLAGYEEGFDPAKKMPKRAGKRYSVSVLGQYIMGNMTFLEPVYFDFNWEQWYDGGENVSVTRWFPLPGKGGEE